MLRLGLGFGLVAAFVLGIFAYGKRQYSRGYENAKSEIASVLNEDARLKEHAASDAEKSVASLPADAKALQMVCDGDFECRDRGSAP